MCDYGYTDWGVGLHKKYKDIILHITLVSCYNNHMGYTKRTLWGVSWTLGLQGITKLIGLLKILVLARFLTPVQFGIFGIASLMLTLLETLTETGVNVFLVQEKEDVRVHLDSAWIVSIGRGIVISVVLLFTAPAVADFFHSPSATGVILLISIVPFLRGFINPSEVIFQKELQFNKEFYFRAGLLLVDGLTSISLALITHSVFSIVFGQIFSVSAEIIVSFLIFKERPRFKLHNEYISKIFHRGKWITLAGVFNYLFLNFDDFVVGRLLNATQLGFYQMAYRFSVYPVIQLFDMFAKVTLPVYVKISYDMSRLKRAFIRTIATVILSLLFALSMWLLAPFVVNIILGSNWLDIVPVIRVLLFVAVMRGIYGLTTTLLFALKKQEYVTLVTLINFLAIAVFIFPMVTQYGIIGAAYAVSIGSVIGLLPQVYYVYKVFN